MDNQNLNDQELVRREKLKKYEDFKVDPFGKAFKVTHLNSEIHSLFDKKSPNSLEKNKPYVTVAGRIKNLRRMGKASFMNIQDKSGNIQVYMGIDVVGKKAYELFKLADIGDIVGVYGRVMKTRSGELTIRAEKYTHLTKCLHPLPEKFHGLVDVEERSRRRYLDLIMNDDARKVAFARPKLIFYLRIATELNLKRLLVGGMERVYEIGRLFRNEGMDATHNPEFTTIEAYQAYSDLQGMRKLAEGMIRKAAKDVTGSDIVTYQDKVINFHKPFRWVSMADLILEKTGIDFRKIYDFEEAKRLADEKGIKLEKHKNTVGHVMNEFFEEFCEAELIQPTFVYSYPIEVSPLTKKGKDPRYTERFELFVNGKELANAYTELNDPLDQKERFLAQLKAKELGDEEANEMDNDFIEALEYGMPPAGGIGKIS